LWRDAKTGGGNPEWSRRWDSNPQPPVYKTGALPLSYAGAKKNRAFAMDNWEKTKKMVAPPGLEPGTN
jgi:hypothetical protein